MVENDHDATTAAALEVFVHTYASHVHIFALYASDFSRLQFLSDIDFFLELLYFTLSVAYFNNVPRWMLLCSLLFYEQFFYIHL